MGMTDPIGDMLTRIRNGNIASHRTVDVPSSKIKNEIAQILREEGYISGCEAIKENGHENIRIALKYESGKKKTITGIKRISKPGLRVYATKDDLPRVLGGFGIAILSTSKGIMTNKKAAREKVGGEVICYVW